MAPQKQTGIRALAVAAARWAASTLVILGVPSAPAGAAQSASASVTDRVEALRERLRSESPAGYSAEDPTNSEGTSDLWDDWNDWDDWKNWEDGR